MTVVRLSPTGLTRWYSLGCPAAWNFGQTLTPLTPNVHLLLGNAVHGLMDGQYAKESIPDDLPGLTPELWKQAGTIFQKLLALRADLGLSVLRDGQGAPLVEVKYEWRLAKNLQYVCKLDALCYDAQGALVVVDYKSTLGMGWKSFLVNGEPVIPQALAFQSASYLLAPNKRIRDRLGITLWPETLYYLVGPARGPVQVVTYRKELNEEKNLKAALALAARAIAHRAFPKVKGKACLACDFRSACYGEAGWKDRFAGRPAHGAPAAEPD